MLFFFCQYNNVLFFRFFFQAADGIRDPLVTGVQTCALPIFDRRDSAGADLRPRTHRRRESADRRSEERRVGKECRSRWWPYHYKKKKNKGRKYTTLLYENKFENPHNSNTLTT